MKIQVIIFLGFLLTISLSQTIIIRNPGCNAYDSSGVCTSCSTRFYKDSKNICQPVNTNCNTYNPINGDCLSCYSGFGLIQGTCLPGLDTGGVAIDLNCNQYQDNNCVKCSFGYYFDPNRICTKADPNCQGFNDQNGDCLSCYPGFSLSKGKCNRQAAKSIDPNCNQLDLNGVCIKCSSGYYFVNKICTKVDDSCKQFDYNNNVCKGCYAGYSLNVGLWGCVKDAIKQNPNPYCSQWSNTTCLNCAKGSIFDKNGICILLDSNCQTTNSATGLCSSCYIGYSLSNGVCNKAAIQEVTDPNCNSFLDSVCTKCSSGYYFNDNRICIKIDDNCKSYSINNRRCMQCYSGYQLENNTFTCVKVIEQVADVNCAEWSGKICVKCSIGASFNNQGVCAILDPQCKQYDQTTSVCKSCYYGYELNSFKVCAVSAVQAVKDPLCAQWKDQNTCLQCSFGSFFGLKGLCVTIDASCKTSNQVTGACLTCYDGYALSNITCVKTVKQVSDVNCAEWSGQICMKCSFGAAFNNLGECVILDSQCKEYDLLSGLCKACYAGYELSNLKVCVKSAIQSVSDALCASWNGTICLKCSSGSYFSSNGRCAQIDTACRVANSLTGACLGCFPGYELNNLGQCVKTVDELSDVNCAQWDGKICSKCSTGSAFNSVRKCVILDAQCKQYDPQTSYCKACYIGYELNNDKVCVKSAIASVKDPNCAVWNGTLCSKCSSGSFFNSFNTCVQVDPSCSLYNKLTGQCLGCYSGYQLSQSKNCEKTVLAGNSSNSLCAEWNDNICTKCSSGSFFNGLGICQGVDSLCKTSNALNGACTSCFDGYKVSGSKCVVSQEDARDQFCQKFNGTKCLSCSFGAYFNSNGFCQLSDSSCLSFSAANGACLTCYPGYVINSGRCQLDKSYTTNDPFCAQFFDQICTRCSDGYYFQKNGKCTIVDPLCNTYDDVSGRCLSCFDGYQLNNGMCVVAKQQSKDPNCASFRGSICISCSKGFIFNVQKDGSKVCTIINPLCRTYNDVTGACLTCYNGYTVSSSTCIIDPNSLDSNCAQMMDSICIKCASRTFMNSKGQCQKVSTDCRTYSDYNGNCLSCYSGFSVNSAGQCAKDQAKAGCAGFDLNGNCNKCSFGYYFSNGQCISIDAQCAKFNNQTLKCQGCYSGYTLLQQKCQISKVDQQYQVKNCYAYTIGNKCLQCLDRFYLSNNQCKEVNVFCKNYDLVSGQCTSCYTGFKLLNGQCSR